MKEVQIDLDELADKINDKLCGDHEYESVVHWENEVDYGRVDICQKCGNSKTMAGKTEEYFWNGED